MRLNIRDLAAKYVRHRFLMTFVTGYRRYRRRSMPISDVPVLCELITSALAKIFISLKSILYLA